MKDKVLLKIIRNYNLNSDNTFQKKNKEILKILDLGCGNGESVNLLLHNNLNAYGCDFSFKPGPNLERLQDEGRLVKIISASPYKIPFENEMFDLVYSDNVLEHVENLDIFFSEISRVLNPGGISMHYYPSINKLIEPHVGIPLATRIRNPLWIKTCRRLGCSKRHWDKHDDEAIIKYLKNNTYFRDNYLIIHAAKKHFGRATFAPKTLLAAYNNKSTTFASKIPGVPRLFNYLWSSLLITEK